MIILLSKHENAFNKPLKCPYFKVVWKPRRTEKLRSVGSRCILKQNFICIGKITKLRNL